MPDITMCRGEGCKQADMCFRCKAKPDAYQSFFTNTPKQPCTYYWPYAKGKADAVGELLDIFSGKADKVRSR